jgi:hypothetical protein
MSSKKKKHFCNLLGKKNHLEIFKKF